MKVNVGKPVYIGFFILALYLTGNGLFHKEQVHPKMSWTHTVDENPSWLLQAKQKMETALHLVAKNALGLEIPLDLGTDSYHELATSQSAEQLRFYLENTYHVTPKEAVAIVASVFRYSEEHRVAPELVFSVISNESSFRTNAKSSVGALGLMQVLPVWHQDKIKVGGGSNELLWNPEFNIKIGTQILREYLNRSKGNVREALARYNGSFGGRTNYPEKVLKEKEHYKRYVSSIKNNV